MTEIVSEAVAGRFGIGIGDDGRRHAVERPHESTASDGAARSAGSLAVCGQWTTEATLWGDWDPDKPTVRTHRCEHCGWVLAMRGAAPMAEEIARYAVTGRDRGVMVAAGTDPDLLHRLLTAILKPESELGAEPLSEIGPGALSSLLAHAARHRPLVLRCEKCTDTASSPDDLDEDNHNCTQVACAGCSLKHGDWAGEWEGYLRADCTVAWPCSVITTMANHHGLGVVSRWARPSGAAAEMPGLPWPGAIAQDGRWHQFAVNYRRDPDDTTYTITPAAGPRGRQVLRVHHPVGFNARSEHAGVKEAKAHVDELMTSFGAASGSRR
ncbi:hypothetical protein B7435_30055 [Mycolicibacterium peregrinum]|uniref:Uncharacterized protein n=1 Tax=Mycolicibacterium alvei TaxID=67081 RepID=A0A6N4V4E6_9MYCO|nr:MULTISPECIES: hypothetical protein [Mycolicibacterium]MCV7003541.1 hypothetical protein [Mycolicibacterium alvei]OWL95533.1 hypothetical protein B7435_30055 [Mycolicibacterium peregrinum]BBX30501.1 hypothetical protein MALV_56260 [Mycolicibacterium alvei]